MNPHDSLRRHREDGVAMVIALMSMTLMLGLGVVLVLTTSAETLIAGHFRAGTEARYAADAGVERVVQDLLAVPDWTQVLAGPSVSSFVDGPPSGVRSLADGSIVDLGRATNLANCGKPTCSAADLDAVTMVRPWGANNPRWRTFAYGPLDRMLSDAANAVLPSHVYVIVWVADDPSENDDEPLRDGVSVTNPGSGVLSIRAEAFGPGGAHRAVEATLRRAPANGADRGYTGQQGGDERNRGGRRAPVQTPGGSLTSQELSLSTGTLR